MTDSQVTIQHDDDMPWSLELLDEVRNASRAVNADIEWCDQFQKELESATAPVPVIKNHERGSKENYRVQLDGEEIGTVTATRDELDLYGRSWEIDILIYERHRGRKASGRALQRVVEAHTDREWTANVYDDNAKKEEVLAALKRAGFEGIGKRQTPSGRMLNCFRRLAK